MISRLQKDIIVKAVRIRLDRGEGIEDIMDSYTKLTADEREEIMKETKEQ